MDVSGASRPLRRDPTTSRLRYVDLLLYKAYADLRAENERTYIGFMWWIIEPVVNMAVFYFVFAYVLNRGQPDYVPFLLTGLVAWKWFGTTFTQGSVSIGANVGLMRQVHVPKLVFPLVVVVVNSVKFLFSFALLLGFLVWYGFELGAECTALPLVLLVELLFIVGATTVICGVMPFLPDLQVLLEHVLRVGFFLSGIFFPLREMPEAVRGFFYLNPMAIVIESYRDVLMEGQWPDFVGLGWVGLGSMGAMLVGVSVLGRYDREYPKRLP